MGRDATLPPQGYAIDIGPDRIDLRAADDAGERYARSTVAQLRAGAADGGIACGRIRDWPDFAVRGYMLDVSRDRVPTRETLDRLVGLCEAARINQLQLYTEHTFAFAEHEDVWRDASPLTGDDVRWLDDRCDAGGIELVPNLNCFGHMGRWLQHDRYRERAEAPDGFEVVPGVTMPPSVLAPTEDNARFALDLLAELLPNFRSRQVNINCDETFDLGHGVSAERVAAEGREHVYASYLAQILEPLTAAGYRVQFWADIIRRAPELARGLPEAAVPICWTYEAPSDLSLAAPDSPAGRLMHELGVEDLTGGFERNTRPLRDAGQPFWVAPGTSTWCSLVGRVDNATVNLLDAATVGVAADCEGYLITDWGDDGHLQPPAVSFGPLLLGGAVAWCRAANADLRVADLLDRVALGASGAGAAIVELGEQWGRTGSRTVNASPLHLALVGGGFGRVGGAPEPVALASVVERLDACADQIGSGPMSCPDGDAVRNELAVAARLARHGAWRMLRRAGGAAPQPVALRADLMEAIEAQRDAWLRRSHPGGLADSLGPLHRRVEQYTAELG